MNEAERAAHVREVLDTCARTLQQAADSRLLLYATGLVLGVRALLQTVEEWQRWGHCVAALLWKRGAHDAGPAEQGEGEA